MPICSCCYCGMLSLGSTHGSLGQNLITLLCCELKWSNGTHKMHLSAGCCQNCLGFCINYSIGWSAKKKNHCKFNMKGKPQRIARVSKVYIILSRTQHIMFLVVSDCGSSTACCNNPEKDIGDFSNSISNILIMSTHLCVVVCGKGSFMTIILRTTPLFVWAIAPFESFCTVIPPESVNCKYGICEMCANKSRMIKEKKQCVQWKSFQLWFLIHSHSFNYRTSFIIAT